MGAADSTKASEIIYKLHGFMSQKKLYLMVKYLRPKFEYLYKFRYVQHKHTHTHTHGYLVLICHYVGCRPLLLVHITNRTCY